MIDFDLPNTVAATSRKLKVVFSSRGRYVEKSIWRHIFAMCAPIWTKFGSLMQSSMQITVMWSKSKPEVEFIYGEHLFFKNGSAHVAAVNRDMSTNFGLLIHFDFLQAVTSTNTKPEVVLCSRFRHLENRYDVIFWHWIVQYGRSSATICRVTDWKRKIAHWSCRYVSPGCYSNVRACVFAGVAKLQNLVNSVSGILTYCHFVLTICNLTFCHFVFLFFIILYSAPAMSLTW